MVDAPCSRVGHIYRKLGIIPPRIKGDDNYVGRVSDVQILADNVTLVCSQLK